MIGAMTRHGDVNRSDVVKRAIPALAPMAGYDRRSRGAQPRHDRRLDREQRPRRRLSGRACVALWTASLRHLTSARSRWTISLPPCSRPPLSPARSEPQWRFTKPQSARIIRNSSIRRRATRLSACSSRRSGGRGTGRGNRRRSCVFRIPEMESCAGPVPFTVDTIKDIPGPGGRPQLGHPRQRRIPRSSGQRDGAAGCRGLRLGHYRFKLNRHSRFRAGAVRGMDNGFAVATPVNSWVGAVLLVEKPPKGSLACAAKYGVRQSAESGSATALRGDQAAKTTGGPRSRLP